MASVLYQGKSVSDSHIAQVLQTISDLFQSDVVLTSGDRSYVPKGGSKRSLHLHHRAADFYVSGVSLAMAFRDSKIYANMIFDSTESYEVIHHGPSTATGGPHLHLGHYSASRGTGFVDFKTEGTSAESKGKYTVHRVLLSKSGVTVR